jgi:predicted O-linked N-acetylglucosamine transferase (SPINDLY family)
VVLFDVGPDQDSETSQARLLAGTYESGQRSLADWVRTIERRGVDVLIYPEVGMDPITQQLASLRLARHQLVSWGHPETTGLPTIDCYLSAAAFESPEADAYYSERLVRLPGLGSYYEPSPERPDAVDMAQLGLDRESPLLVSAGTPFKYGPHHDAVWLQVARQLGRCQLVFFESPFTRMNRKFRTRLEAAFSASGLAPGEFLRFVPWQTASGFLGLLAEADVFLDTIGFSGFNTVMQAVECNLPVVTVAGRFMRGRFGSGILTEMGMPEYIAGSADDYATQAVRLAGDKDVNARMRQRMREASSALFQNRAAIAALDDLLGSLGT